MCDGTGFEFSVALRPQRRGAQDCHLDCHTSSGALTPKGSTVILLPRLAIEVVSLDRRNQHGVVRDNDGCYFYPSPREYNRHHLGQLICIEHFDVHSERYVVPI